MVRAAKTAKAKKRAPKSVKAKKRAAKAVTATATDITNIKRALVGAGILKAIALSQADEAKVTEALARQGIDAKKRNVKVICSWSHWCLVIPKTTTAT
jgi:hypothetical protein